MFSQASHLKLMRQTQTYCRVIPENNNNIIKKQIGSNLLSIMSYGWNPKDRQPSITRQQQAKPTNPHKNTIA